MQVWHSFNKLLYLLYANCLLAVFAEFIFAQGISSPSYPYGGVPDSSRIIVIDSSKIIVPINFTNLSLEQNFFDSLADFRHSKFIGQTSFGGTRFKKFATFRYSTFTGPAIFVLESEYSSLVEDRYARTVKINVTAFLNSANFEAVRFDSLAKFQLAVFKGIANFDGARFNGRVDFHFSKFEFASFEHAHFASVVDFGSARFERYVSFYHSSFDSLLHLAGMRCNGELVLGSRSGQKFDLTNVIFGSQAKIVIKDNVELKMQWERLEYAHLYKELSYWEKASIIDQLKETSFKDNKSAILELGYILAKSTIYQDRSDVYKQNKWYEVLKWPKWVLKTVYYVTMGLGYRPFRLVWWTLAIVVASACVYLGIMRQRINAFVTTNFASLAEFRPSELIKQSLELNLWESLLNCLYFSASVFFSFRLRKEILVFFNNQEKRVVVSEWLLGFLVYVAFLTLSESGSILQNLKDLVIGN